MYKVILQNFNLPQVNEREVWRYAACKTADETLRRLLQDCLMESQDTFVGRACYCKLSVSDFYAFVDGAAQSQGVQNRLCDCKEVIIFAASVGLGIDRLMEKYAKISPAKALLLQAIGAERIETLCDEVCAYLQTQYGEITPRFGAGYGDFPLSAQKDFFRLLDCPKNIGVSLTDALLMVPTKSVTAFVGVGNGEEQAGCVVCKKKDCIIRKE